MPENQKFLILLFKHKHTKKVSRFLNNFPYKEAKFSKLKYFLTIIIKCFISRYIFFYTQHSW